MSHVIVLIHGTWARNAHWTREGSELRNALQNLDSESKIEALDWSGGNSFVARREAVMKLQHCLKTHLENDPNTRITLIAHSHGGNIAMATAEDENIRAHLRSVVCLSTPFILVGEHAYRLPARAQTTVGILLKYLPWMIYAYLTLFLILLVVMDKTRSWGAAAVPVLIGAGVYGFTRFFQRWHATFWQRYDRDVLNFVADNQIRKSDDVRLLVLRPVADEASSAINMTQFISWLSTQVWNCVAWVPGACARVFSVSEGWAKKHSVHLWLLTIGFFFTLIALVLATPSVGTMQDRKEVALALCVTSILFIPLSRVILGRAYIFVLFPFTVAASVILLALFLPVAVAITLAATPFGLARVHLMPSLRISAEAAPAGHSHIVQLPAAKNKGLMHSTTYLDLTAIHATVQWVRGGM